MHPHLLFAKYTDLQKYVRWTDADTQRIRLAAKLVEPAIPALIDDFYAEIQRHPAASRVITGGAAQIARLKETLRDWLRKLFSGLYDEEFVAQRWKVGRRHVEIGLDQVYTNVALSRIRNGLMKQLTDQWSGAKEELAAALQSLNRLLDLDLAVIEEAYQFAHAERQRRLDDLSMRGKIAEAKTRSESMFRDLVNAAGCVIVILRSNFTIAYLNAFAQQLTGYTEAEVFGKDFFALLAPGGEREQGRSSFARCLELGEVRNVQRSLCCRDGSTALILWNGCRLDHFLEGPAVLGVGVDITRLKEAEGQAQRSQRLAAIGQMVAGIAHEGRNALQRSQACLEMLDLEVGANTQAQDLIRRIQRAQDQLHKLFEDLRGYVAPLKLDLADCRLDEIWREAWELLTAQRKGRDIQFVEHTLELELACRVDRFRLVQVFRNLLENSLAASADPAQITIRCRDAKFRGRPALQISVCDNGPGIPAEQRQQIFEPFFTTKVQGTGLGMAIAQRIVDAHQGNIEVAPDCERGAEIVLTLPRLPTGE